MSFETSAEFMPEPFPDNVPVADLARISLAKLLDDDQDEAALLFEVCKTNGFCYLDLTTHPKGLELIKDAEEVHRASKEAFEKTPINAKREFKTRPPETGLLDTGYRETGCGDDGLPNKLEMFNISQAGLFSGTEDYKLPPFLAPHEDTFRDILRRANVVHNVILGTLERQLKLPSGTLTSIHKLTQRSGDFVRILNYPAPKDGKPLADPPTPPHRDAVSVAFLFTWQGGLQITAAPNEYRRIDTALEDEESWQFVRPLPGHVIMNLGDALHILTNGLLNSGKHRVVTPPGRQALHDRISVLLVARPEESTQMRTLPSPLLPPGNYLPTDMTAKEWGQEKVIRVLRLMDNAKH
ncbi:uncharacterized protein K452DRAFT_293354 [Aplosporella prunicola CBS 121167]|uniref:Fe2OG dioxygenase domain-containing protein n=1 Tax=Aplosporella prunicola CBS 121167 TaxID=1176127 RepID=A0A6A6AXH2_9PEZI|nr:uncharacterized protein K452DRAFT_293354 [Aplosporella prunicola CBS 121167]KAF2135261.1 hypothetical protein K452DRAFT_293354 [Aplosporella prunicola CBS 121167]